MNKSKKSTLDKLVGTFSTVKVNEDLGLFYFFVLTSHSTFCINHP